MIAGIEQVDVGILIEGWASDQRPKIASTSEHSMVHDESSFFIIVLADHIETYSVFKGKLLH